MDEEDDQISGQAAVIRKSLTTFPFSKTTCVCNCGKYNLQDLPRLRKILPEDYEYKLCEYLPLDREDKFLVTLRMTLTTREEALEWKRRFEERSLTTHVKDKTFPKVERVSIFKAQYRCQFFDRRKNKKKLPEKSKFRDCHSILFMNIKKYFKNTVDRHMPTYQTIVRLHYAHDHPLDTADVLKKRHLNEDIKCRFLEMFRQGMKPKDALDKHKRELLQNLGPEKYRQVVCDGYYVPNVPKTYRLYYQIHGKGVSAKTSTKRSSRHNPNPDWIAFQNFPDAISADNDDDCDLDGDAHDSDDVPDDSGSSGAIIDENGDVEVEQHHLGAGISCQGILDQEGNQLILTPGVAAKDTTITQSLPATHSHVSRPTIDNVTTQSMVSHDGHLQKLASADITYSNISTHESMYTDMRGANLPTQTLPLSSFVDTHSGMGLFNLSQSSWENFNMAHQQTVAPTIQHQHCLGFHNLGHQNSPTSSYIILPNVNCENSGSHFVPAHGINQNAGHQNISRTFPTDVNSTGSNPGQQCSWTQIQHHNNTSISAIHAHPQEVKRDKIQPSKELDQNQTARKPSVKKAVHKKKKPTKELNMKHVTKRWMDKKPKVEAETQNLASEVLQTILLTDEAEKLKVKLLTFLSGLESKMTSNPRLFVPAIRHFLYTAEGAEGDSKLALYLKDFGKTEENVIKNLEAKKIESREHHSTQTKLSGPVFKLGNVKSNRRNISNRSINNTASLNPKPQFAEKSKSPAVVSRVRRKQKLKVIFEPPIVTENKLQSSESDSLDHCQLEQKMGFELNDRNFQDCCRQLKHAGTIPSKCGKQLKKTTKSVREIKKRRTISRNKQTRPRNHQSKEQVILAEEESIISGNFTKRHKVAGDAIYASKGLVKKHVVKFTGIKQKTESDKDVE